MATPGQFAGSAAKRRWYNRMVWREMLVMRSISRWVAPPLSSVQMVVCRCGFKTFTPLFPSLRGVESNVLPVGPRSARRIGFNASDQRGQVEQFGWP